MNPRVRPILLVEDNPMDLDLTCQAFREHSVANPLAICRDGEEALEYIEAHPHASDPQMPILVLLDLRLPKVSGLEVLKRMRADPVRKLVPVVILTSSKEESDLTNGYALGTNSYIRKPVDFEQFSETVRHLGMYWLVLNEAPPVGALEKA